ncbi:MAG: serine/threonine protein kinase [Deltaproteobacteria bacterium]|nr:serine/threonine protein kinase [Deltaproteobacteria bacterium]
MLARPRLPRSAPRLASVGRLQVLSELGSGGMASVYLARDPQRDEPVAVKVLHPHLLDDPLFVDMFLDEARVVARLRHPNVVPLYEVLQDDDTLAAILGYVEGDTLAALVRGAIAREVHLPLGVVLRVALDALAGLHAAHELTDELGSPLQVVHRDVSPHNILVGVDGSARLLDFGVAKAENRITQTRGGVIKGKLAYMAPEQVAGLAIDRRVDVFALGVTLWEALTLRSLFDGDSDVERVQKVTRCEVPTLTHFDPALPEGLDACVRGALALRPAGRYPSAEAFASALTEGFGPYVATRDELRHYMSEAASQKLSREREAVSQVRDGALLDRCMHVPSIPVSGEAATELRAPVALVLSSPPLGRLFSDAPGPSPQEGLRPLDDGSFLLRIEELSGTHGPRTHTYTPSLASLEPPEFIEESVIIGEAVEAPEPVELPPEVRFAVRQSFIPPPPGGMASKTYFVGLAGASALAWAAWHLVTRL